MNIKKTFIPVIILCCFSLLCEAQRLLNGSITPSVTIQSVMSFTLNSNSSPTITFNSGSYYVNGYTVSNFNTIAVKANMPWNLFISSATSNFTNSGVYSTPNTPSTILTFGVEGKSNHVVLSTTPKLLNAGSNGNNSEPGNIFNISFTTNPGYEYGPGTYTISTIYTLTSQ